MRGRSFIEKIRHLLELYLNVVVHHSYRESNQSTDALTNYGCSMDSGVVFFDVCPSSVRHLLLADLLGISTPCVIS
jgi:hypothetical protein